MGVWLAVRSGDGWPVCVWLLALSSIVCCSSGCQDSESGSQDSTTEAVREFMAKRALSHVDSDGRTPETIRDTYLGKIRAGDKRAAAEALVSVQSVIEEEGGLFSSVLAQVAAEALLVSPDEKFIMMLARNVLRENRAWQKGPSFVLVTQNGDSAWVLAVQPRLAVDALTQILGERDRTPDEAMLILQELGHLPPFWEYGDRVLTALQKYDEIGNIRRDCTSWLDRAHEKATALYGLPSHSLDQAIEEAVKQARKGDGHAAWKRLDEAVRRGNEEKAIRYRVAALFLAAQAGDFDDWRCQWTDDSPNRTGDRNHFEDWLTQWEPYLEKGWAEDAEVASDGDTGTVTLVGPYRRCSVLIRAARSAQGWRIASVEVVVGLVDRPNE